MPWSTPVMPVMVPARLTRVRVYSFEIGDQYTCSFFLRMFRMKLTPHTCSSFSGKRRVIMGMAISAVHPSGVRWATTSHTPSQFTLMLEVLVPRQPPSPSSDTCCSSFAPRGLVTNM